MSKKNQLDALVEAAEARWRHHTCTEPMSSNWGMFAYSDAHAACGGGLGFFVWFNSRTALLNFVEEVLPYSPPGPRASNPLDVAAKVQDVLLAVRSGSLDLEKGRMKLNLALRSYSQIEWIGTFKNLKDGNDTYAKKVIKDFRRSFDMPVGAIPVVVAPPQLKDFKNFLAEYGI